MTYQNFVTNQRLSHAIKSYILRYGYKRESYELQYSYSRDKQKWKTIPKEKRRWIYAPCFPTSLTVCALKQNDCDANKIVKPINPILSFLKTVPCMIRLILVYPFFPLEHGENVFLNMQLM